MYQSPIRLFKHLQLSDDLLQDNLQLLKVKKLVNAEFAIANNGVININEIDYNKADILAEIDNSEFVQRLAVHHLIWNNSSFLAFMEQAELQTAIIKMDEWQSILNNELFQTYFGLAFAQSFNKCSSQYIYEFNFEMLGNLLKLSKFISDEYFDEAYQNIRVMLDSGIKLFKNTSKANYETDPNLDRWIYNNFGKFISKLPFGFDEQINSFAVAAINLSVELQSLKTKHSVRISHQLTYLTDLVLPEYAELIRKNHGVFSGNSPSNKSWWNGKYGIGVGAAIVIFRILAALFSNHSSDNPINEYKTIERSSDTNTRKDDEPPVEESQQFIETKDSSKQPIKIDTTTFKNYK